MFRTLLAATTALGVLTHPAAAFPVTPPERPAPGSAPAQDGARAIRPGQTVQGELRRGDDTLKTGEYTDAWTFPVRAGETYEIALSSPAFDPYLMVRGPGGLSEDNDDDPAARGSHDSRIRFTAPAAGEVEIGATSYEPGETGAYRLTLSASGAGPARSDPADASGAIAVGRTVGGSLASGDEQLGTGEFIDTWTLRGRRGQQLDIRLTSTDFDPYLMVRGPGDFSSDNDDDAGAEGSHDSRLLVTLPADGEYQVSATSYEPKESGAYRLAVLDGAGQSAPRPPSEAPSARSAVGGQVAIGEAVSGALAGGDEILDSGEYVDTYRFRGRRGQRVTVDLTSSAFDAYTMVTTPSGEQFDNDDGEDGTDSRQALVLPEDGDYEVRVTSFRPGETGSYRFSVDSGREPPRQAAVAGGARVFALMVGVSDYGPDVNDLPFTDEDARKLAEVLQRDGSLNEASVVLTNAEATVGGVRAAFARIAAQAGPDDMFLFFFSGHGGQEPTPVTALEPDGKAETLVLADGEIADAELARLFATLDTRLALLVVDACFSGGFARNVVDRPGVMGVFSSEEDLTSAVADKFQAGGYLSHFVRAGMSGEADGDGDRLVTAGELATYLRRQFRVEVEDVQAETQDGQRNYQNLVIDRGGVQVDDVIVRLPPTVIAAAGR
ncbi:pre-peptidase C-terminal domain-containing protein [Brevundimonas sp.]|uniref:pre-peptidase C-terminal domain-containing protein n=1 Tax=Brevundimonas sp. TaxID=1871086 RepID=UPI002D536517|nr:pre-peptidase C-terminal domain-containing protein [Brevundimonas sp.]HYC98761.1 pre-peptidase C-terminal domain-containing protein [Brevundimonas sp.]